MTKPKVVPDSVEGQLYALGWDYVPTGPNEWDWLKFDVAGKRIAMGGDEVWEEDLKKARS